MTDISIEEGVAHTTTWDDARDTYSWLYPRIEGTGISDANELNFPPYSDLTYQEEGVVYKFDQRTYTTPGNFGKANLALWGFLYAPNRCIDGTVAQCHLMLYHSGCGGGPKTGDVSEQKVGVFGQDFGWAAMAHANDVVMLAITNRDNCYNMEYSLFGQRNDKNYLKKDAAMTSAIMGMIEQLKGEKDPDLDLPNLENIVNPFIVDDYQGEGDKFGDTLGVWLSMSSSSFTTNILSFIGL